MSHAAPFDLSLPSPIGRLAHLRARSREAVVRDDKPTAVQQLMAPAGALETAVWEALGEPDGPGLLVLTGSAGSGKSAMINHLLRFERESRAGRIGTYLADATHADAPDQAQASRLAEFFRPFADDAVRDGEPCRLIAMNTGMALRFFHDLQDLSAAPPLAGLEALLRRRLGLPGATGEIPAWLDEAVLVVNLDHRPTAGQAGDLFDDVLRRLDPESRDGVLEGAPRCHTCTVRNWCWPMANAAAMASSRGRAALNAAAGDVAVTRGRQLAPRALWDAAAELALSGADVDQHNQEGRDPCFVIADVAADRNEVKLLQGIACNYALAHARAGTLAGEIAERDPGYFPSRDAHEIISDAGLAPESDGQRLGSWLADSEHPHPAVTRASQILAAGRTDSSGPRFEGRLLSRAAWLANELQGHSGLPAEFANALRAQANGAGSNDATDDGALLYDALGAIEEGLAEVFGFRSDADFYYPTADSAHDTQADLLVEAKLVEDDWITTQPDPVIAGNPRGSALVGYRPLALTLKAGVRSITVDYPLWRLLRRAAAGATPSNVELERFLALRQSIRAIGVAVAAEGRHSLLVRERGPAGSKFRIISRGGASGMLRAVEVR
ncbi:hypothetical protein Asp14428_33270 [Actinoplanes sp. NBRC 14428]|nr:hypothetical protein Asp14428_33270 [Actinoplanes sp. NBRC 14428]